MSKKSEVNPIKREETSVQRLYRPVLYEKIPDVPLLLDKDSYAYKFWETHIYRCLHGWIAPDGKYINPIQYFYMNFVSIKIGNEEKGNFEIGSPYYRDNDDDITSLTWNCLPRTLPNGKKKKGENIVGAKSRGIGWTQLSNYAIGLWLFVFKPDLPIGFAYPDDELRSKERIEFANCWKRLHPIFKRYNGKRLEVMHNSDEKGFSVYFVDEENEKLLDKKAKKKDSEDLAFNTAYFKIASVDAGVFKGFRLNLIVAHEAGKWTNLKKFITENKDCIRLGDDYFGIYFIGGTSNAINNKSTDYKRLCFNPQSQHFKLHFTPATKVFKGCIDLHTGKSLVEEALKKITERRAELEEESDTDGLLQETIENPLNLRECFIPNVSFAYNISTIEKEIEYIKQNSSDDCWLRGSLEYEYDITNSTKTGRVIFTKDKDGLKEKEKGKWMINLSRQPTKHYRDLFIGAIDDVMKSQVSQEKADKAESKNCFIIYSRPTIHEVKSDFPVAIYYDRIADINMTYEEFLKGIIFYNLGEASVLYEYNAEAFVTFLRDRGYKQVLYHIEGQPGIKVLHEQRVEMTRLMNQFMSEGRLKNINCIPILEALKLWEIDSKRNTDIGSTWHLIILLLYYLRNKEIKESEAENKKSSAVIRLGRQENAEIQIVSQKPVVIKLGQRRENVY